MLLINWWEPWTAAPKPKGQDSSVVVEMSHQTTSALEKDFEMVDCLLKVQVLHNVAEYVADLLNSKIEYWVGKPAFLGCCKHNGRDSR